MNHFLRGFTDELIKVGAFGQQTTPDDATDSSDVGAAMKKNYGPNAAVGLKSGPQATSMARRSVVAPSPLTTPSSMIDLASKSGV